MIRSKISALTELTTPAVGDFFPVVDTSAGATRKLSYANVAGLVSGKYGDVVIYNSAQKGPYADGPAAVADIEAGGTFWLIGDWDTATEGAGIVPAVPCTIRGTGWTRYLAATDTVTYGGSRITNVAAAACIDFTAADAGTQHRWDHCAVEDIFIYQNGAAEAIKFSSVIHPAVKDTNILCGATNTYGILVETKAGAETETDSFFADFDNVTIRDFGIQGVRMVSGGGANEFRNCHIISTRATATAAVYANQQVHIKGGQLDCDYGKGFWLHATGNTSYGGSYSDVWCESGTHAVYIDAEVATEWNGFTINNPRISLNGTAVGIGIYINSANNVVVNQMQGPFTGDTLINFGPDGGHHTINLSCRELAGSSAITLTSTVPEATSVRVKNALDADITAMVANIPSTLPVVIEYASSQSKFNVSTVDGGTTWQNADGTTYTPA